MQRRRFMPHRSPTIFWLLLAATIGVDAVAIAWLFASNYSEWWPTYRVNVVSALTLGQLSVISIWMVFRRQHDAWSLILPVGALIAASWIRGKLRLFGGFTMADYAFRSALQMLGSVVVLWLVVRTPLWRKLSPDSAHPKWEYSVRDLLLVMTATAALSALVARSTWNEGRPVPLTQAIGILAPPAVAVGVVILAQFNVHWLVRAVGYLVVGAVVGTCLAAFRNFDILKQLNVEFMLEALVIAVWIEWGGIIPCIANSTESNVSLPRS